MKRACLFVSAAVIGFAMGCGGGPAPTSPSHVAAESPAGTTTSSPSSTPALFGASVVDFARCLQGAEDAGCFAGARIQARAVGAAATAPGAPINLSTSSSGSTVTLTWGAPASGDPVSTYLIEAGSGPGLANLANFPTNSTATTFSAGGVGAGTYYVRVRAQNTGGTSAASNESILVVGSVACTSAPNAPASLVTAVSGSTVTLTWNAPAGGCAPSSYVLQAGSSAGASDLANANVGASTTYVASGVGTGTYYVRVRAVNAFGQSGPSNEAALTVGGTSTPNLSGPWSGSTGPYPLVVSFQHSGTTLAGTLTTPPNYGSFALTQVASSGTTLTFSGTFRINPDGSERCPQIGRPGTMTVNTATNTMTGSFTGENGECRNETNIFEFHRN